MTPYTRREIYLAALGGDDVIIPDSVTREEVYLAAAVNHGDEKIIEETDAWLAENVDPDTGYVLDRSLQMENAAAPADLVGDIGANVETIGEPITTAQIKALFE